MPIISAITPQIKNPDFYNLIIDGKFVCGVDVNTIGNYKLKVSKEISFLSKFFTFTQMNKFPFEAHDFIQYI